MVHQLLNNWCTWHEIISGCLNCYELLQRIEKYLSKLMLFTQKYIILEVNEKLIRKGKSWQKLQKAICHTLATRHTTE